MLKFFFYSLPHYDNMKILLPAYRQTSLQTNGANFTFFPYVVRKEQSGQNVSEGFPTFSLVPLASKDDRKLPVVNQ